MPPNRDVVVAAGVLVAPKSDVPPLVLGAPKILPVVVVVGCVAPNRDVVPEYLKEKGISLNNSVFTCNFWH